MQTLYIPITTYSPQRTNRKNINRHKKKHPLQTHQIEHIQANDILVYPLWFSSNFFFFPPFTFFSLPQSFTLVCEQKNSIDRGEVSQYQYHDWFQIPLGVIARIYGSLTSIDVPLYTKNHFCIDSYIFSIGSQPPSGFWPSQFLLETSIFTQFCQVLD